MMNTILKSIYARVLVSAFCITLSSAEQTNADEKASSSPSRHVRLLAIGNSFSKNATRYLPDIVKAAGDQLTFQHICIGGCPLEKHWKNAEAFQKGSTQVMASAWSALTAEKWDFVTIQQYSMYSFKIETYRPYAKLLHDYIKGKNPQAALLIHETWAYREDDPLFKKTMTQQEMYWRVRNAYETIASELGCRIIPSGDAFENARTDPDWKGVFPDPKFDYKRTQYPDLPDQTHSLHAGYSWKKAGNKWKLNIDGHHAGPAGEYLAAAVWYETLFGKSIVGNTFVPNHIKQDKIMILQRIAHKTVTENIRPPEVNKLH